MAQKSRERGWDVDLDPVTVAALREWWAVQLAERAFFERDYRDTDRVFVWEDGRPVHPDVVRQRFNRLSARCGLPHIRLHDMRHSHATVALTSFLSHAAADNEAAAQLH
jgi:integrase